MSYCGVIAYRIGSLEQAEMTGRPCGIRDINGATDDPRMQKLEANARLVRRFFGSRRLGRKERAGRGVQRGHTRAATGNLRLRRGKQSSNFTQFGAGSANGRRNRFKPFAWFPGGQGQTGLRFGAASLSESMTCPG